MAIRLVTLDCANTLLRGQWDPVGFALWAAREAGLCLPARAASVYGGLLKSHYPAILAANRTGSPEAVRAEYVRLGEAWLSELGVDPKIAPDVVAESERLLVSPELFEPFPDTAPFLEAARARGVRLAVVSNWDVSLFAVLKAHGLAERINDAYASLVVGAEKPDPTMLHLAMKAAGVAPDETLHIGDDATDDLGAAQNAGVKGLLLDRSDSPRPGTIHSLLEALEWIA